MTFTIKTDMKTRKQVLRMGKLNKELRESIRQSFLKIGSQLKKNAEVQAKEVKYGREYPRYDKNDKRLKPDHTASEPLQSPAILSGFYLDSFDFNARTNELEFFNDAFYAEFLEEGTEIMSIRPGLENSVKHTTATMREYFETNLAEALDLES